MPSMITFGAASSYGFGANLNVSKTILGWLISLGISGKMLNGGAIKKDSSGNIYIGGYSYPNILLIKFTETGTLSWAVTLSGSPSAYAEIDMELDSSGNIYIVSYGAASGNNAALLAKYNSTGSLVFQKILGGTSSTINTIGKKICIDSNNYLYIICEYLVSGRTQMQVVKYSPAGAVVWQNYISASTTADSSSSGISCPVTATPTIITIGRLANDILFQGYNYSNGQVQWQFKLAKGSTFQYSSYVKCDSSGNAYLCYYNGDSGSANAFIVKINSTGTVQWQTSLSNSYNCYIYGLDFDSSGNIYVVGDARNVSGKSNGMIVKYNSSGVIQYQRTFTAVQDCVFLSIKVDTAKSLMYITGQITLSSSYKIAFLELPLDGSLTGSYVFDGITCTYAVSSLTVSTPTITRATTGFSSSSTGLTEGTGNLTSSSVTLTQNTTYLP
jgi:hypothetical protein